MYDQTFGMHVVYAMIIIIAPRAFMRSAKNVNINYFTMPLRLTFTDRPMASALTSSN